MFARWSSPEAVFQILKEVSTEMPNDITGIRDYRMLDECGGIQWPLSEADACRAQASDAKVRIPSERRLFEEGRFFTVDGRARFLFEEPGRAGTADGQYPFLLLTGRGTSSQWHTNTRTGKSAVLRKLIPRTAMSNKSRGRPKLQSKELHGHDFLAAGHHSSNRLCHPDGPTGTNLHSDALWRGESVDVSGLRPGFASAIV